MRLLSEAEGYVDRQLQAHRPRRDINAMVLAKMQDDVMPGHDLNFDSEPDDENMETPLFFDRPSSPSSAADSHEQATAFFKPLDMPQKPLLQPRTMLTPTSEKPPQVRSHEFHYLINLLLLDVP